MKKVVVLLCLLFFILGCNKEQAEEINENVPLKNITGVTKMKLTSLTFENGGKIPAKYTCDGENISPPLTISDVPAKTQSLVLIMDDPDAPLGVWDHWIVFNLSLTIKEIKEGTEPSGMRGKNSWGKTGYGGPCPPSGEHRYFFKLYALDVKLNLPEGSSKKEIEKTMEGHVLARAELIGTYQRK